MGKKEDFMDLPEYYRREHLLEGKAAYLEVLKYSLGLKGKSIGETQIVGQLKKAWQGFDEKKPSQAAKLRPIWEGLMHDSTLIRGQVTGKLTPPRIETAAFIASNQKGGETVLIVGDKMPRDNQMTELTRNLARKLGGNHKNRVGRILVTHPDPGTLGIIYRDLQQEIKNDSIKSAVEAVPFEEFLKRRLLEPKTVYIATPMGSSEKMDQAMINALEERNALSPNLAIHVRGTPELRGLSSEVWRQLHQKLDSLHDKLTLEEAIEIQTSRGAKLECFKDPRIGLNGYISPEELKGVQKEHHKLNESILEKAENACNNCAILRVDHNKRPLKKGITLPPAEYLAQLGLAPAGRFVD
jgi:hypothetical protein